MADARRTDSIGSALSMRNMRRCCRMRDGLVESQVFPGLRLAVNALIGGDLATVLSELQKGLETAEHAAFVRRLLEKGRGKMTHTSRRFVPKFYLAEVTPIYGRIGHRTF